MLAQPDFVDGTLRELLLALRAGFVLHRPVLVDLSGPIPGEASIDHTITMMQPIEWEGAAGLEYADQRVVLLGPNILRASAHVPLTMGRSRRCDVRVTHESVSKVHCAFHLDAETGAYSVTDEGARNGTFLNGEAVPPRTRVPMWAGVHLGLGEAIFVFLDPPTLRQLARLAP